MKPERLQKIDQVFQSALDLAPERRLRFLDQACAAEPDLRREVESLLDAHERAGDFIEDSAADVAAQLLAEKQMLVPVGGMVGHYRVDVLLGAGGMGEVYLTLTSLECADLSALWSARDLSQPRRAEFTSQKARGVKPPGTEVWTQDDFWLRR